MTTRLEESQAAIDAAKVALADLEQQAEELRQEAIRLSTSNDVDDRLRRKELLELRTEILDGEIPNAKKDVKDAEIEHRKVREDRKAEAKRVAAMEAASIAWDGEAEECAESLRRWAERFRKAGWTEKAYTLQTYANKVQREVVEWLPSLPVWQEKLAEYGDDPDGELPSESSFDEAVRRADRDGREQQGRLRFVELEHEQVRRELAGARG